ncbi:hypothetical protein IscW_ISCW023051 [Ixodes scapularis]|uniref:Uncharacterized protein n=1 Tax=Ixodes scapularis TaxID=6945 RepID=B7QKS3_IXOSC|nr:hypothetical protein IscW_ISCW023051 [Ixodes scapularis]|eukprot:XP_002415778.1 hypothetical protein IscW_ISCW023051 [Ixodes scapularis]
MRLQKMAQDLHTHSKYNKLEEKAEASERAQMDRLKATEAGRQIPRYVRYDTGRLPPLRRKAND